MLIISKCSISSSFAFLLPEEINAVHTSPSVEDKSFVAVIRESENISLIISLYLTALLFKIENISLETVDETNMASIMNTVSHLC